MIWVAICVVVFSLPQVPAAVPWRDEFDWKFVNYAPIAVLVVIVAVGLWWLISARNTFKGPIREVATDETGACCRARRPHRARLPRSPRKLSRVTLDELKQAVADGTVDTVLLAIADMEGRLQGKRLTATHFLNDVAEHGAEGCNYLLAVDVDMTTVDGYEMSSWDRGYGDFQMKPDLETLRPVPWHPGTVLLMADIQWHDGRDVAASPRQILRRQLDRLAERGLSANAGTELEFIVFRNPYEEAWKRGYRDLEPANLYNIDYSLLGGARVEPLIRRIRNEMAAAGMTVENSKGECNLGQHEINFHYGDALRVADEHVIYKTGAKEIAAQEGMSITFMAKWDEREGNSCHIHCSLGRATARTRSPATSSSSGASSPGSWRACAS